jgi:hypothetical protein
MKRGLSILIAAILLASGMHISIDRHYCGGTLADVKISVTGKLASCGMEEAEPECSNHPVFDQKCCEDQISYFSTSSNYFPECFSIIHPVSGKEIMLFQTDNPISVISSDTNSYFRVFPPGENFRSGLTQPEMCVFRI